MDLQHVIDRVTQEVKESLAGPQPSGGPKGAGASTLVVYTQAVAGFAQLMARLQAEGHAVTLIAPKYGTHSLDLQRLRDKGVTVVQADYTGALPAVPPFSRLVLPGLHRIAMGTEGGVLDGAIQRARELGAPIAALYEGAESKPAWLPAGAEWLSLVNYACPNAKQVAGSELARMIDHTLLKADATEAEIRKLCAEAAEYKFASVCVNPGWVKLSAQLLKGTGVMVCTVIGFPLGATDAATKGDETRHAVANGASEIDMVINVGAMKSKDYDTVTLDIASVVKAAGGKTVKVILETGHLTDEEKAIACGLAKGAGAHFVKTSTGMGPGGATAEDIALMRRMVGPSLGVKASGGIRDTATALKMVAAGANRIGCSAGIAIIKGQSAGGSGY